MAAAPALAWRQLVREKLRLIVAIGGVAFAVVLMLMQLGFRQSLLNQCINMHRLLVAELVLISRDTQALQFVRGFPRRYLSQAMGHADVESVAGLRLGLARWKNPFDNTYRNIYVVGINPDDTVLDMPEVNAARDTLKLPEHVVFDAMGRREYGPVGAELEAGRPVRTEIGERRVIVAGLYHLGVSFWAEGSVVASTDTFQQIQGADPDQIELGLIKLRPGADVEAVRAALAGTIPANTLVLTKEALMDKEVKFWHDNTAVGFIFGFGVIMGFFVGSVIVYQILYADVSDHLPEYATLKAMGYTNRYMIGVVLGEAVILALLGFLPGAGLSYLLYRVCENGAQLPMHLSPSLLTLVLGLTVAMCCVSGTIAVRKVQSADPADVF